MFVKNHAPQSRVIGLVEILEYSIRARDIKVMGTTETKSTYVEHEK